MSDPLLDDLEKARKKAERVSECPACRAVQDMSPGDRREAVIGHLSGTIGTRTLSHILQSHGILVSREAIVNHRKQGHRP